MALAPNTTLAVYGTLLASYHFPKSKTWTFAPHCYKASSLTAPGTLIILESSGFNCRKFHPRL